VLSESEVWHVHTVSNGLIDRMDLKESGASADSTPSAAFSKQSGCSELFQRRSSGAKALLILLDLRHG